MQEIKQRISALLDTYRAELEHMADDIFDHPETGFNEVYASGLLCGWLEAHGFAVQRSVGTISTAFRAEYQCGEGGPAIGLLAEYDALAGIGHACGHHLQGPCMLGVAQAIKELIKDQPYKLVLYGTPAEETAGGKIIMADEGCFRDIDVALMMHGSPTSTCDIKSLANYGLDVTFTGTSAHAAIAPEKGRSALDALLLTFQAVEYLREHVKDDVRMHYTVKSTYDIPANVVPDKATGSFSLRSYNTHTLEEVYSRFCKIVQGAALMTETEGKIAVCSHMSAKVPVLSLNDLLLENARLAGLPRIAPPREKTGSTDFANVMELVPGTCMRVAFVPEGAVAHSQEYLDNGKSRSGHNAILYGAKALAFTVADLITGPGLMHRIREDFEESRERMKREA